MTAAPDDTGATSPGTAPADPHAHAPAILHWRRRMAPRDGTEPHRVSTPLELFFDLCFVVAVAQAGTHLHHAFDEEHVRAGLLGYLTVFFAIWWAWMNFTWFASAYDVDDVPYRVAVLVQITGSLIIAAGVPRAFDNHDWVVVIAGYCVMRFALVAQWIRAAVADPARRSTNVAYAVGLTVAQAGWLSLPALSGTAQSVLFGILVVVELLVPAIAESRERTPWHPHHIAERYGLFTLIVLGESVGAATLAVQTAVDDHLATTRLYLVAAGGLLTVFSLRWAYFSKSAVGFLTDSRAAFRWGYGHYVVFASAAAVGAGLAVNVDHATGAAHISQRAAGATVTVPVALFLLSLWLLHWQPQHRGVAPTVAAPVGAALVLAATFTPRPVLLTGVVASLVVVWGVTWSARPRVRRSNT